MSYSLDQELNRQDSLTFYKNYFAESKTIKKDSGATSKSKLIHNKLVKINKHQWADAMHLSSELPYYYTRYLATIKGNVAVLISFTSHKKFYTKYSGQFFMVHCRYQCVYNGPVGQFPNC